VLTIAVTKLNQNLQEPAAAPSSEPPHYDLTMLPILQCISILFFYAIRFAFVTIVSKLRRTNENLCLHEQHLRQCYVLSKSVHGKKHQHLVPSACDMIISHKTL